VHIKFSHLHENVQPHSINSLSSFLFSLRIPLPKLINPEISVGNPTTKSHADNPARKLACGVLEDSLINLDSMPCKNNRVIRWELGSSWLQHLQKKDSPVSENGKGNTAKVEKEQPVKGLGKHFEELRKIKKKESSAEASSSEKEESNNNCSSVNGMHESDKIEVYETSKESDISKLVPNYAFLRLQSLGAGLHEKVCKFNHLEITFKMASSIHSICL
jgi:protein TIF31